mmetsp:Transcript_16884/g.25971  ORF Transcript_16884/g.25971 Transcript_16884/m.25971 type:complete len:116 (-) Transcript_16884:198-545(-)
MKPCKSLKNLLLSSNKVEDVSTLESLAIAFPSLERLSLISNLVVNLPNYRMYVIWLFKSLRVLDFQKVTQKERQEANALFKLEGRLDGVSVVDHLQATSKAYKELVGRQRMIRAH